VNQYYKDIIKISWPIIIGQLGMVFTGFFDTLMVGQLGYKELAAAGICNSIFFLVAVFPMGVTMAFATIVGMLQGKNKTSSYNLLARDSALITVGLALVTTLVTYVFIQEFHVFGQTADVAALATPYLTLLMWSMPPMLIFFFAKNLCDGFGFTFGGMVITLAALALNVFLNWVLIFGKFGFPAYGLNGAGYATIISRIFLAVSMLWLMLRSDKVPIIARSFIRSFTDFSRITFFRKIWQIGFPTGLQYFFEVGAFAGAAIMAGWLGSQELAAHNLAITLASLTYMFAGGISAGSSICVAKAYGNGNTTNVKNFGKAGLVIGLIVMIVFASIFFFFNTLLTQLFTDEPRVVLMGSQLLILAAIFQLSDGIQTISIGILRGVADVKVPSLLIFVAYWIIAMPLGYLMSHTSDTTVFWHGVNGIWLGLSIGLTLSACVLSYRFYSLLRNS
jgi:MATE family multidrug resistance protein